MNESSVVAVVRREEPCTLEARALIDEMSAMLALYGAHAAQSSLYRDTLTMPRSAFVMARTVDGEAIGCGALRRFSFEVAELQNIYRRPEWSGAGGAIVQHLERLAVSMGYRRVIVRTQAANRRAIEFGLRHGYERVDSPAPGTAVFAKSLAPRPWP